MNNTHGIFCILIALFLSGCATGTPASRSASEQRAATLQTRALRAAEKHDHQSAEQLLREALAINTSIEDNPQKVITLINLARLQRLNNDLENAQLNIARALAIQLDDQSIRAESYHEKALLELAMHKPDKALKAAKISIDSEEGIYRGKRRNVIGRCLYEMGNKKEALSESITALSENRSSGLQEEEANSLFMLGIIAREEKQYEESGKHLHQALVIDKQLGLTLKIGRDLEALANSSLAAGNTKEARIYLERAMELYGAAGETSKTKAITEHIQKLTTSPSSKP